METDIIISLGPHDLAALDAWIASQPLAIDRSVAAQGMVQAALALIATAQADGSSPAP